LAVKIVRQPKKIALLGAPSSAAALAAGHERAPAALRAAGIVERLTAAGFEVADHGDAGPVLFQSDEEHPRARNIPAILRGLNDLRPRVEVALKSGALPVILGGDCISVLATVAAARRYYRHVSLVYMDRDADLNVPATTPSGCVDGMTISQVIGRGAPELTRFWGEPPLVREPDILLFGLDRLDPPEEQFLARSPLQRHMAQDVAALGGGAAARRALEHSHVANREFVLHFDVDVISSEEFRATNFSGPGGLKLDDARAALAEFARQPNLIAIEFTAYNPDLDPEGQGARMLVELIADSLAPRLSAQSTETPPQVAAQPLAEISSATSAAAANSPASNSSATESAPGPSEPAVNSSAPPAADPDHP